MRRLLTYQAAKSETINPNAVRAVADSMDQAASADQTGILARPVNAARNLLVATPGTPAVPATRTPVELPNGTIYRTTAAQPATPDILSNDIANLDRARKYLRDKIDLPPFAAEAIPKEEGKVVGGLIGELRDRMKRNSNNFAQGRQEFERISNNIVEPFSNSPTGQLATAATPQAQRAILFPETPLPGSENGIGNAMASIMARNPDLAKLVVRQEAERAANSTVNGLTSTGSPDQWGGAKFAESFRDNPHYAKNFDTVLTRSGGDAGGFKGLLDALQATGKRQGPGSFTAQNTLDLKEMAAPSGLGAMGEAITNPLSILPHVRAAVARARLESRSGAIANAMVDNPADAIAWLRGAQDRAAPIPVPMALSPIAALFAAQYGAH